jgi:hypothetical protein
MIKSRVQVDLQRQEKALCALQAFVDFSEPKILEFNLFFFFFKVYLLYVSTL